MSPQDRELMRQALEDLRMVAPDTCVETIEALRARLAEPDDEPVAWMDPSIKADDQAFAFPDRKQKWPHLYKVPLYTRPAARKVQPLTDAQIEEIWKAHVLPGFGERQKFYSPHVYARAIERAHGIGEPK